MDAVKIITLILIIGAAMALDYFSPIGSGADTKKSIKYLFRIVAVFIVIGVFVYMMREYIW